jgi:MOSC domain-containing protein YiiM
MSNPLPAELAASTVLRVRYLFVSTGHNYFGHHGQAAGQHPVVEVPQVECLAGRGIRGDRFLDHKENYKGQITFFSLEVFEQMKRELGLVQAHPGQTRRNVIVNGPDLAVLVGTEFTVQGVRFLGTEECRPCYWMNQAFGHPQAEEWLKGRGGLRARILNGGILKSET